MNTDVPAHLASRASLSVLTRAFGWAVLAHFAVWMVSNMLTHSFGWPGAAAVYQGGASSFFRTSNGLPITRHRLCHSWVWRTRNTGLRDDAEMISHFNAALVRWAFFAVLFIGLADMVISFLRVEGILEAVVGKEMTTASGPLGISWSLGSCSDGLAGLVF